MFGPDHAQRSKFKVGMKVYFGRKRGEKTLGEVVKMNPRKAKVKQLEERGAIRDYPIGTLWTVPFTLMEPADPTTVPNVPTGPAIQRTPPAREKLVYNPFDSDNDLLDALAGCYNGLSPENLSCDGEASMSHIRHTRNELNRKIKGINIALGRTVSEDEIMDWQLSKMDYQRKQQQKTA